ncbi:MAG: glycoside hydrolase family 30 protein, partial [Janthinobacterium lividum]
MFAKALAFSLFVLVPGPSAAQTAASWVTTTATAPWQAQPAVRPTAAASPPDVAIDLTQPAQTITGFGACFNELGWTALRLLPAADREAVFRELFAPGVGANFTICRLPVGANDFSRDWYSYDETPGDFAMQHFSIAHDRETLIPFIKQAQRQYPALRLWASPWSPPTWMKYNKHYAAAAVLPEYRKVFPTLADNGLPVDRQGKEGHNLFIQEEPYFQAYALYFSKFIEAYRQEGIRVGMVMPQNEFNSAQVFPSCPWTAAG